MDGKGGRGRSSGDARRRQKTGVKNVRTIAHYLKTHIQALLAGGLVITLIVLLFGVFSNFQGPVLSTPPTGETVLDYSSFLAQVKAGNMLAVNIRGSDLNGLLVRSLSQPNTGKPAITPDQRAQDFTAFSRYVGASSTWAASPQAQTLDTSRLIYARLPATGDASLMPLLVSNHVQISTLPPVQTPAWLAILWRIIPFLFIVLIIAFMLAPRSRGRSTRGMDERFSQMGKSKARLFGKDTTTQEQKNAASGKSASRKSDAPGKTNITSPTAFNAKKTGATTPMRTLPVSPVTFADVAGIDEVREELEEIVQYLRGSERYEKLGAKIPRGALLVGPPGTGKTLLAKAVAGEAGVPFYSMSASEFVEMFVGVGASRVRDLFSKARQSAPCVIFIDEIDAVGRKRSIKAMGNDERDQTLNQLLVELDGFNDRQAIVVLAATNRVDILDKALLRPGRFDRHITVSLPDRVGREAILRVHTRKTPLHEEVSLERLARLTTGMSGADLANLVNEAALVAARRNLDSIDHDCFEDALARVQLGALRPIVMNERERRIIAYHEGGHALVAYHQPEADTVNRVTILPRGQSLGVTQFTSEEDRYNYSRQTLMARIAVGLGGRVSEELTFGADRVTTGAENDLQVVTNIARNMVTRWGMSQQVGVVFADYRAEAGGAGLNMRRIDHDAVPSYSHALAADVDGRLVLRKQELPPRYYASTMPAATANKASSLTMANTIDAEVQLILNEGYAMARTILQEHSDQLTKLADALMEHEQLDRKQFEALLQE
ncbi:MAG: ATP-dependent zinc metalloprotease FtsH [Ktedonobacteraceae bacterium]